MKGKGSPGGRRKGKNGGSFHIGAILGSSFSSLGIAGKLREHSIRKAWAGCVGENISRKAAPSRLIGTTLYCSVVSSPWMAELSFHKQSMIEKINEKLGYPAVSEIVFKLGPVEPPKQAKVVAAPVKELSPSDREFIEKAASAIKDEGIKKAVKRAMEKAKG
ncbi:MAG: DUF721 domain-containing protein [Deltaproteobacteria bacterium]|nr:DUF721 domain-containing protein [Deltaproteobacteria bacterium]